MSSHEIFEHLLMKAVDDELTPEEREELEGHLGACSRCREELDDFSRLKKSTDTLRSRIMADASIIPPREAGGTRRLVVGATLLLAVGAAMLLAHAGYVFFTAEDVSSFVKVSVALVTVGSVLLGALALGQRLRGHRRDPYSEIDQ